jgi:hypothetical protein
VLFGGRRTPCRGLEVLRIVSDARNARLVGRAFGRRLVGYVCSLRVLRSSLLGCFKQKLELELGYEGNGGDLNGLVDTIPHVLSGCRRLISMPGILRVIEAVYAKTGTTNETYLTIESSVGERMSYDSCQEERAVKGPISLLCRRNTQRTAHRLESRCRM